MNHIVFTKLRKNKQVIQSYSAILVVPDCFEKEFVKIMIDIIFKEIGFKQVFLHQESVLATFGSGIPTCCVVDIGAQKITVCCIDEGIILPGSCVKINFGGLDIDLLLAKLLSAKIQNLDISDPERALFYVQQVENIKIKAGQLIMPQIQSIFKIKIQDYDTQEVQEVILSTHDVEITVACNSFFYPRLIEIALGQMQYDLTYNPIVFSQPEDYYEEAAQLERDLQAESQYQQGLFSLEQAIVLSLQSATNEELRNKLVGNILLIGGMCQNTDLPQILNQRLEEKYKQEFQQDPPQINISTQISHSDSEGKREVIQPSILSWVGAASIVQLESSKEL